MNVITKAAIVVLIISMFSLPAVAGETAPTQLSFANIDPADVQEKVFETQALALKRLDFEVFAKSKVNQLNRNHISSRSRMKITKQPDGTYLGSFHQIDDSTLSVKVRRSQSGSIPYVGILSYQEQIFESTASTREGLDLGSFDLVKVIPNRHIFSYRKGAWN